MNTFVRIALILLLSAPALAERPISFMPLEWPDDGALVLPVAAGEELTGLAAELDQRTDGAISMAAAEAGFKGEAQQTLTAKPFQI